MHAAGRANPVFALPGLFAYYDSVFSKPEVLPDGRVERWPDLSGNERHLRVRTEAAKIHPTYDLNAFGALPGIGNSLEAQKVELRGEQDIRSLVTDQQTWYFVYRSYRLTSLRIMSLGSNYHNPIDHPTGLAWGRNQAGGFPRTYLPLINGAVCTCLFNSKSELILRVNGVQGPSVIDPNDGYAATTSYARYIHLFTGWDLIAIEGVFGAVALCMEAHSLPLIQKVERYLSKRFSIPLNA